MGNTLYSTHVHAAVSNSEEKIMLLPCQKSDLGLLGENQGTSILLSDMKSMGQKPMYITIYVNVYWRNEMF